MMLALGEFLFTLHAAAYQELARQTAWRWSAQPRAGRLPARQYVGPGDDTLTLRGAVFPHLRGGLGQLGRLREEAGRGRPLRLVTGTGAVMGLWCVERVEETQTVFWADGRPRRIEFRLEASRYGEDEPAAEP